MKVKNAIVRKLREQLSGPIDTECKVVYVLCETRKLLEKYPPQSYPLTLKLYCHWALHIDLSYTKTTLPLLERVEEYVAGSVQEHGKFVKEEQLLRDFIYLDTFREQFKFFLASYGLPVDVCDHDGRWLSFLSAYARVIEDGSLTCDAKKLRHVKKVEFSKGTPLTEGGYVPFVVVWTIHLHSGYKMTLEIEGGSAPDDTGSILWVRTLGK